MDPVNGATPTQPNTPTQWRDLHPFAKMLLVLAGLVVGLLAVGCTGGAAKWALWVLTDWTPGK